MIPDWLPDWKDGSKYPDELIPRYWAWEFLRRNPAYRADYQRYAALPKEVKAHSFDYDGPETPTDGHVFNPPALPGERLKDYSKRVGGKYCVGPPLWLELSEKYGLFILLDPDCAAPDYLAFSAQNTRYVSFIPGIPNSFKLKTTNELAVFFDLALPIKGQLKRAKRLLESRRRELDTSEKRPRADKLQVYLRLLDAEASGASIKEMAATLFPDKSNSYSDGYLGDKNARNGLDSARRIRDHGYTYLTL